MSYSNLQEELNEICSYKHVVIHSKKNFNCKHGKTTNKIENLQSLLKKFCPSPINFEYLNRKLILFTFMEGNLNNSSEMINKFIEIIKINK